MLFLFAVLLLFLVPSSSQTCPNGYYKVGSKCHKCSPSCDGGRVMVKKCTANQDIICECPTGKFWDTSIVFCKRCSQCHVGEISVVNCTHSHNRQCVKCNPGTFAATPTRCEPCTHCGKGEITQQKCNTSHNTICEVVNTHEIHLSDPPTKRTGTVLLYKRSPTPKIIFRKEAVNSILMTIVGVLSLVLVFGIVMFCCNRKKKRASKTLSHKRTSIDTMSSENDTFINKETVPIVTHDPGILMRNVNPEVICKLGCLLNPDGLNNWVKVASALQFTQVDINFFNINKESAFQTLLKTWSTRRDATVYRLYQIFLKMDRDDCATILEDVLLCQSV